jgi:hypothetical protein
MHSPQGSIWTRAPLLATDVFFGKQSAQLEKRTHDAAKRKSGVN